MKSDPYFAFADFVRALENLEKNLRNEQDRYLLLTGETGVGKTMLCRQLNTALDRCRYRVLYFSLARLLSATGLLRVLCAYLCVFAYMQHPKRTGPHGRTYPYTGPV